MTAYDNDAVRAIAARLGEEDKGSSSHWDKYHSEFKYENGKLSGIAGFGDGRGSGTFLHKIMHRMLQTPFFKMGADFRTFPECLRLGREVAARQERQFDVDVLRQALSLALLRDRLPMSLLEDPIVVIGDGFGTMTSLLVSWNPKIKVVLINLTKTLLVDTVYIRRAQPEARLCYVDSEDTYQAALGDASVRVIVVRADDYGLLAKGPVALALNIASMQEMNPSTVAEYFRVLRASSGESTHFYCCNRLEKTLPDGTQVNFREYPWRDADQVLLDDLCPWHQYYYHPAPPFYRRYDGPLQHRLVLLDKS